VAYILMLGGLALLFVGGEALLRGSVAISTKLKVSTLLVSMVVVGFGTSAPEFLVSILAALQGAPSLALGNVLGSNIANILLILGVSAAISPVICEGKQILRDTFAVLLATLLLGLLTFVGEVNAWVGALLLTLLIAYLTTVYRLERQAEVSVKNEAIKDIDEDVPGHTMGIKGAVLVGIAGLIALSLGAHFLVKGATQIALAYGVSDAVIGLTIVAVGTSLPELATALVSAYRGHAGVVLGNVIGSNLFNILGVLGATAIAAPIPLEGKIAEVDVWIAVAVAAILIPATLTGKRLSRMEGIVFLILYVLFVYQTFGEA